MTGLDATIARALAGYDAGDVLSFDSCPAYPSWVPREGQAHVTHLPEPRTT